MPTGWATSLPWSMDRPAARSRTASSETAFDAWRRAWRARLQEGRRPRDLQPEPAGVRSRHAGRGVPGRHRHHGQSALHGRRAGQAARGLGGPAPRDGAALPRQGEGSGGEERRSRTIFVFGDPAGARPFTELLAAGDRPPAVAIDPRDDIVVLPYSSGTTGLPKGVMLTHRNLVANLCQSTACGNFDGFGERT